MTRRENIQSQDAAAAAAQWLAEFGAALQRQDAGAAADLFVPEGHWRDIVAFTWHIATFTGPARIAAALDDTLAAARPTRFGSILRAHRRDG